MNHDAKSETEEKAKHGELSPLIETPRLKIHRRSLEDDEELFQVIIQNRDHLGHFLQWVKHTVSLTDTQIYLQEAQIQWNQRSTFDYTIRDRSNAKIIGAIGVHSISWDSQRCEIGYWLDQLSEGQGLLSEALAALENEIFKLGFHRIEVRCEATNIRSAHVALRNGYVYEGLLRHNIRRTPNSTTPSLGEEFADSLIFAKLQSPIAERSQPAVPYTSNSTTNTALHPWLQGVDFIYLFVENIIESATWYAKVFGIEPTHCSDVFAEVQASHQTKISFHRADQKSPISTGGCVAYFKTWNWSKTLQHFIDNGATIYRGPLKIPTGQSIAQLRDPFGQVIGLIGYADEFKMN